MRTCRTCQKTYPDDFTLCPRDGARLTAPTTETEAQLAAGLSRRFRLVRRLGAGGMGTVFLAEQIGVGNRPVALKVLNRKLLDDPDFLMRFQNEAGSTGRISQENVVTIYESGQADDGTPYIAMEFLEGESLREALSLRGALPVTEVAEILQQAARGLNAAHKLGIIHRDLKPDNIFLTHSDEGELIVKVVDFGIAKLRESAMHTQTGMVLGTPAYMSCEQASGMRSDELDARSDIYSLGVVAYEMLTGRVPFHSDTPVGYLRKHMLEAPPPFRGVAQGLGVPTAVEITVMKALAKDRNQRYASVLDFAGELTRAAQLSSAAESPVTILPTRIVPTPAIVPAKVGIAVQNPPPAPLQRIVEAPVAPPQGSKPVGGALFSGTAASRPPAASRAPQFRTIAEPPGKMKFVVIAVVALILVVAGVWHFSQQGAKMEAPEHVMQGTASAPASAAPVQQTKKPPLGGISQSLADASVSSEQVQGIEAAIGQEEGPYCASDPDPSACRTYFRKAISFEPVVLSPSDQRGVVVEDSLTGHCGSEGCPIYIVKQDAKTYTIILKEFGGLNSFVFAKTTTNGFFDVTVNAGSVGTPTHTKYVWNGSKYV